MAIKKDKIPRIMEKIFVVDALNELRINCITFNDNLYSL